MNEPEPQSQTSSLSSLDAYIFRMCAHPRTAVIAAFPAVLALYRLAYAPGEWSTLAFSGTFGFLACLLLLLALACKSLLLPLLGAYYGQRRSHPGTEASRTHSPLRVAHRRRHRGQRRVYSLKFGCSQDEDSTADLILKHVVSVVTGFPLALASFWRCRAVLSNRQESRAARTMQ